MEEEITPTPEYIKAFNNGYLMAKHDPKTLNAVLQSTSANNSDYIKGLRDSMKQFELEKLQQQREKQQTQSRKTRR